MSLVCNVLSLAIHTPQPQSRIGGWNQTFNSSEQEALQESGLGKRLQCPPVCSHRPGNWSTLAAARPPGAPGLPVSTHPTPGSAQLGLRHCHWISSATHPERPLYSAWDPQTANGRTSNRPLNTSPSVETTFPEAAPALLTTFPGSPPPWPAGRSACPLPPFLAPSASGRRPHRLGSWNPGSLGLSS